MTQLYSHQLYKFSYSYLLCRSHLRKYHYPRLGLWLLETVGCGSCVGLLYGFLEYPVDQIIKSQYTLILIREGSQIDFAAGNIFACFFFFWGGGGGEFYTRTFLKF